MLWGALFAMTVSARSGPRTGSLWLPVALHTALNAVALVGMRLLPSRLPGETALAMLAQAALVAALGARMIA